MIEAAASPRLSAALRATAGIPRSFRTRVLARRGASRVLSDLPSRARLGARRALGRARRGGHAHAHPASQGRARRGDQWQLSPDRRAARGPARDRVRPAPRRSVRRHAARRLRRRRHQGRGAARRRPDAGVGPAAAQRPFALVVGAVAQQALGRAQPARAARPGDRGRSSARRADVIVENFRPGTMERWDLGPERRARRQPAAASMRASRATARPAATATARASPRAARRSPACATSTAIPARRRRARASRSATRSPRSRRSRESCWRSTRATRAARRGQVVDAAIADACFAMTESPVVEYDKVGFVREPTGPLLPRSRPRTSTARRTASGS